MAYYTIKNVGEKSYVPVAICDNQSDSEIYPPGFSYFVDGVVCTVIEDVSEGTMQSRIVLTSDGDKEEVSIESIFKDLKSSSAKVLAPNAMYINIAEAKNMQKEKEKEKERS